MAWLDFPPHILQHSGFLPQHVYEQTNKRTNERATTSSTEPLKTFASYVPAVEQDGRTAARCMKSADYTNLFLAPDLIWWRWRWCPLGVPYKDSTNDRTEYHLASLLFIDRKIALPRSNESSPDQRRSNKKIRLGSLFMVVMVMDGAVHARDDLVSSRPRVDQKIGWLSRLSHFV